MIGHVRLLSPVAAPARRAPDVAGPLVDRIRHRLVATAGQTEDPPLASIVRDEAAVLADDVVLAELRREVAAELSGTGPLEQLLEIPGVTDVLVNGPSEVWIDRGHGVERTALTFPDDAAVRRLAQRLAAGAGRRLDDASPFVDAALAGRHPAARGAPTDHRAPRDFAASTAPAPVHDPAAGAGRASPSCSWPSSPPGSRFW